PTITLLDSLALNGGGLRFSVLTVIKGVFALSVLFWAVMLLARGTEQCISAIGSLTPSLRVRLTKLAKIVLMTIAVAIAISAVGIDLTAFAVFGGAIGIGVGLGLQKSIANLISGVMILLDKTIKPGDVIEVGEAYGQVKSLGGRYASIITCNGVEHLIPNEDLIGQKIANWTHSSSVIRLRIPVGVSYNADIRRAMALMEEAAAETERLIKHRPPVVQMKGFGDSSVDLELLVWITDPMNGLANIKSEILLGVWDKFREHGLNCHFRNGICTSVRSYPWNWHRKWPIDATARLWKKARALIGITYEISRPDLHRHGPSWSGRYPVGSCNRCRR
ncbi:MAG: mechanosensitive ion channel domain-containing protein, partial [Alphaproteobacteria bacterium]